MGVLLAGVGIASALAGFAVLYLRLRRGRLGTTPRGGPSLLSIKPRPSLQAESSLRSIRFGSAGEGSASPGGNADVEMKSAPPPKPKKQGKKKDALHVGQVVYYKHNYHGWIFCKVAAIDHEGSLDGGVTYLMEGPQIDGVLETVRDKLFTQLPSS